MLAVSHINVHDKANNNDLRSGVKRLSTSVFRFAPSPTGYLHLGHAYSALVNYEAAKRVGGRFLLRLENIDQIRCKPEYEEAIMTDLAWLGLEWEEPVLRQSDHFDLYEQAMEKLKEMKLVYPAVLSRKEVKEFANNLPGNSEWPRDPDGVPIYPPEEMVINEKERKFRISSDGESVWRLDMARALAVINDKLNWKELEENSNNEFRVVSSDPMEWGNVLLARKDTPTSYHLSVTVDDAIQGVTDIVRGYDLYPSTIVHRVLQSLLKFPEPRYHHHRLVLDDSGRKLSKSKGDTSLRVLRKKGISVRELRKLIGLDC